MKQYTRALMLVGFAVSMFFGLWHFIIPYQYRWYSYIPDAPRAVIVSIDWINFFFSLMLTGNSLILIIFRKRVYRKDSLALALYIFMLFVWFCRIAVTVIRPWSERFDTMLAVQVALFTIVFLLLLLPLIQAISQKSRRPE
jgi:hypothetical protein